MRQWGERRKGWPWQGSPNVWADPRLPRPTGEVMDRDTLDSGRPHGNLGLLPLLSSFLSPCFFFHWKGSIHASTFRLVDILIVSKIFALMCWDQRCSHTHKKKKQKGEGSLNSSSEKFKFYLSKRRLLVYLAKFSRNNFQFSNVAHSLQLPFFLSSRYFCIFFSKSRVLKNLSASLLGVSF